MIQFIIFSKNRSCQLDFFLRSIKLYAEWLLNKVVVLYKADNEFFQQGYEEIQYLHPSITMIKESDFKNDLIEIIDPKIEYIMFGVDDDVFINEFIFNDFQWIRQINSFTYSLRLNNRMDYCYTENRVYPNLPKFDKIDDKIIWNWKEISGGDYGYPFSLDCNIYRFSDIEKYIRDLEYHSPNTLEGETAKYRDNFENRKMVAFQENKIINLAINKVQSDNGNRCGVISAEYLNQMFLEGHRLSFDSLIGIPDNSPHIDYIKMKWSKDAVNN